MYPYVPRHLFCKNLVKLAPIPTPAAGINILPFASLSIPPFSVPRLLLWFHLPHGTTFFTESYKNMVFFFFELLVSFNNFIKYFWRATRKYHLAESSTISFFLSFLLPSWIHSSSCLAWNSFMQMKATWG